MIKLVISDIGGVLVKTDQAIISAIEKVFEINNITPGSREKLLEAFGVSIFDYIKNYLPAGYEDRAEFIYDEFKKIYPDEFVDVMQVFPRVNETLKQIKEKGVKIAIISCMIKKEVETNLSLLEFQDFDLVFSLDDYGYKRPLPNGLNMIMNKLDMRDTETLYVGDTIKDIQMAKNARVTSVAVKTGAQDNLKLSSYNPNYLIETFEQILDII